VAGFASQLDQLEHHYGRQHPAWPTEPYEFLVWWHCGYPASDTTCAKGWAALGAFTGLKPQQLLECKTAALTRVLKAGGLIPDVRARRIHDIARRVVDDFHGNLAAALAQLPPEDTRKALKRFPGIGDPGADRMMLFGDMAPIAAIPSNATQVAVRIQHGDSLGSYAKDYSEGVKLIESHVSAAIPSRKRAYLLLKIHGETLCKRAKPKCEDCPIARGCAFLRSE